jgi:nucleotide-binding universal stress UspA family protein
MHSILVYADRGPGMPARLETALSLAKCTGGHLTLLVDTPVARYVAMDPMGGSFVASDALNQALADDDANARAIEGQLKNQKVAIDIVRSEAEPVEALAAAARLADLVIVPRSSGMAGDVALAARTPVLALPDGVSLSFPLAAACIAWDGGDESAFALRGAVPLLASCTRVQVLTVIEKSGGLPASDALRYLSRHGISAELRELSRAGSTEETLARALRDCGGKLLVMGAYGKSRMREYLFGGVTRYFLEETKGQALLLAH